MRERLVVALIFALELGCAALLTASTVSAFLSKRLDEGRHVADPPAASQPVAPSVWAASTRGWPASHDHQREHERSCEAFAPRSLARPRLIATIVSDDPRTSRAVVFIGDEVRVFAIGESWEDASLADIARGTATLHTRCEAALALLLEESGDGVRPAVASGVVAPVVKVNVADVLGNIEAIAKQARITPTFQDGHMAFKLFAIQPGSYYARAGLENGDIVQKVDGQDVDQLSQMGKIEELRQKGVVNVEVKRRGTSLTIPVALE